MKALGLVGLLVVLGIAGWIMVGQGGPSAALGGGELAEASRAQAMEQSARNAVAEADLANLKTAVSAFQAAQGRLPGSLDELKDGGYIQSVPAGVRYDPATGAVTAVP